MNKKQTGAFQQCKRLLRTALEDLERGYRVDAGDAIRMAQRELRESMGDAAQFLPAVTELSRSVAPGTIYVTFAEDVTPSQMFMVKYTLNQMVKRK